MTGAGSQPIAITRRAAFQFAATALALSGSAQVIHAQTYPVRPVHWVVPFPAGGPSDIVARLVAPALSAKLGQPFVIENRIGASGNIGTRSVASASPDGHTLLLAAAPNAINAAIYSNPGFDFVGDFAPVALIGRGALVMLVTPSLPTTTVAEFIAYAKECQGKLNMASSGIGTPPHVAGELFKLMAGIDLLHVPYRGIAPAMTDLLGGQVHVLFDPLPSAIGYIRTGQLRALAVTTAQRSPSLPDIPALTDIRPGYEASTWFGVCAPKRTPSGVVTKLNDAIRAAVADPSMKKSLEDVGASPFSGSPKDFADFIADETAKWTKVAKLAGIKAD